jgi:hypothetical protein
MLCASRCMEEWRYSSTIFDLDTSWRWLVSSRPGHFTPVEIAPGAHWIGWVILRVVLDAVEEKIIAILDIERGLVQAVAHRETLVIFCRTRRRYIPEDRTLTGNAVRISNCAQILQLINIRVNNTTWQKNSSNPESGTEAFRVGWQTVTKVILL